MSHLADHARAADILGDAFEGQASLSMRAQLANGSPDDDRDLLLMSIATAYRVAADNMRKEIAAGRLDHACTVDHRTMKGARCGLCGAPKS